MAEAEAVQGMAAELPMGPVSLVLASGLPGVLILLLALPLLLGALLTVILARTPRWPVIMLGLSLLPVFLGALGFLWGGVSMFLTMAQMEEPALPDLAAGLSCSLMCPLLGLLVGGPVLILSVIGVGAACGRRKTD
jgi:hypothetical protein